MTARRLIKTAPASERLTGRELIEQSVARRPAAENVDLRSASFDPAAAGDVYGTHRPLPPVVPMSPDYQSDFHSSSGA